MQKAAKRSNEIAAVFRILLLSGKAYQ